MGVRWERLGELGGGGVRKRRGSGEQSFRFHGDQQLPCPGCGGPPSSRSSPSPEAGICPDPRGPQLPNHPGGDDHRRLPPLETRAPPKGRAGQSLLAGGSSWG